MRWRFWMPSGFRPKVEADCEGSNLNSSPRFFYGWVVVAACFVAAFSYGLFYSYSVFFRPLQDTFGWGRALTSSAQTVHYGILACSTFGIGWLTDRFGPRLPLFGGAVAMGLGFGLISQVDNIWQLYLFYGLASVGAGVVWSLPMATVQRWFTAKRSLAMGIAAAGIGAGAMVIAPVASFLILSYGWRTAYVIVAIGIFALLSLAAWVISADPAQKGQTPYNAGAVVAPTTSTDVGRAAVESASLDWTLKQALVTRGFVMPTLVYLLSIFPVLMTMIHIVPFGEDVGIPKISAAGTMSIIGVTSIIGRIGVSSLVERVGWRYSVTIVCGTAALTTLLLLVTSKLWMLYLFAVIFGLCFGANAPLVPGILGSFFGTARLGAIIGACHALTVAGSSTGPFVAGIVFDHTQSYDLAFAIAAVFWALAAVLSLAIRPPQRNAGRGHIRHYGRF